jgi:hypothetical protein
MPEENNREESKSVWSFLCAGRARELSAGLAGRSLAVMAGCLCMMIGVVLTLTICGAIVGLPLLAFGFLLMARGLF